MKEYRAFAKVKASALRKAYDFTVAKKYGVNKGKIDSTLDIALRR